MGRYLRHLSVGQAAAPPLARSRHALALPFAGMLVLLGLLASTGLAVASFGNNQRARSAQVAAPQK